jgi:hypothetical protein
MCGSIAATTVEGSSGSVIGDQSRRRNVSAYHFRPRAQGSQPSFFSCSTSAWCASSAAPDCIGERSRERKNGEPIGSPTCGTA